jgi:HAD superfamily hydrolase (TIGR01509 family)
LTNEQSQFRAVVFDMDGVLADSEPVYYRAMNDVLNPLGHKVTDEHQRAIMGHSIEDTWLYLQQAFDLKGPLDLLVEMYDLELRRLLLQVHEPLPGVRELIAELRQHRVPIAVASSSLPEWIEALLTGLGLYAAFDALVSATMVEHPKPAPDIYIEAARRLGVAPGQTIGIEDTPTGLASAKAAGLFTIQVRASSTAFEPLPDADLVLASLRDFDFELVKGTGSREQGT